MFPQLPTFVAKNGSVIANTTAVKSVSGCQPVTVSVCARFNSFYCLIILIGQYATDAYGLEQLRQFQGL